MNYDPLAHLDDELCALERANLLRRPPPPLEPGALSFCSNDYLGLAAAPPPELTPAGSGASRLIAGERVEHPKLERAFARWLGEEAALVFTSGWAANVGTVAALARPGDLIVSDALNHASLIDGARLSKARIVVAPHNDLSAVEHALATRSEARAWVLVESYYSMDADGPDLRHLRAICDRHRAALLVDEAHAIGVLGPRGRGLLAAAGVRADVVVAALGKAFGAQGAIVAGRAVLRSYLWNRARSFVFSTGLSPASAAAASRSLERIEGTDDLQGAVLALADRLRHGLIAAGASPSEEALANPNRPLVLGTGHVVPVVLGDPARAMRVAELMRAQGLHVQAVRPPTVPTGTARLRLTVTAGHSTADIDRLVAAYAEATTHVAMSA